MVLAVRQRAQIMNQKHIHRIDAQPAKAFLDLAFHGRPGIIEIGSGVSGIDKAGFAGHFTMGQAAPHLGGQDRPGRLASQKRPQPRFRQAVTIIGCRIEEPNTAGRCSLQSGLRIAIGKRCIKIAKRRTAHAERRQRRKFQFIGEIMVHA